MNYVWLRDANKSRLMVKHCGKVLVGKERWHCIVLLPRSKTNGLVLSQMKSQGKKNENVSVLEMLDLLELKGAIVTMDAMNIQKKLLRGLIKKVAIMYCQLKIITVIYIMKYRTILKNCIKKIN